MKKLIPLLAVLLALSLLLTGCKSYEDTNGPDDFSLQTLTEQNILKGGSCTRIGSVESSLGDRRSVRVSTLNGVDTLETFSSSGSYSIRVSFTVSKGNARLVLCTENEILHDFDVNGTDQSCSFDVGRDTVYLRIAGENCGFSLEYSYERR